MFLCLHGKGGGVTRPTGWSDLDRRRPFLCLRRQYPPLMRWIKGPAYLVGPSGLPGRPPDAARLADHLGLLLIGVCGGLWPWLRRVALV